MEFWQRPLNRLVASAICFASLACLNAFAGPLDWGDVPTWIASIATSGTLVATAITVRQGQQDRHLRLQAELAGQAKDVRLTRIETFAALIQTDNYSRWARRVTVKNQSIDPIYDVRLELRVTSVELLFPDQEPVAVASRPMLVADDEFSVDLNPRFLRTARGSTSVPGARAAEIQACLVFTDAQGLTWRRGADYRLSVVA